ncbi:type II secretion system F family protein [Microbacterium betulae]|uniref:Type II secretion system F family protein n=1 Tax=Microbacterium betulae TaxID=2981139 RepID=A0AA97FKI2_9MICO|nr:type II secretion system F family protein [Microbacterium sp. AB]
MILLLGAVLAGGLLLAAAPWLWPVREKRVHDGPAPLSSLLEAAGFAHVAPRVFVALCAAAALAAAAVAWLLTTVAVLAALAALAAGLGPIVWLRGRAQGLVRLRRGLWPDVCDLLVASVRAGMSLPDAVSSLAHAAPAPLRAAFEGFARDMAASGHFDSSADRLKTALSDPMGDRIIETLRMARQVGGTELTPVLRALSASVRVDVAVRAEVESRQSWTRGAAILGAVAPWVIVALLAMRPEGAEAYSSPEGVGLLLVGAAVSFVAFRVMLRIGRLPEARRWFA